MFRQIAHSIRNYLPTLLVVMLLAAFAASLVYSSKARAPHEITSNAPCTPEENRDSDARLAIIKLIDAFDSSPTVATLSPMILEARRLLEDRRLNRTEFCALVPIYNDMAAYYLSVCNNDLPVSAEDRGRTRIKMNWKSQVVSLRERLAKSSTPP